jgi:hypothetical protein
VDLVIDREKDKSSLTLSFGSPDSDVADRRRIELVGPPNLFPTFAVPDQLPPVSAYTQATFKEGTSVSVQTIDSVGLCESSP